MEEGKTSQNDCGGHILELVGSNRTYFESFVSIVGDLGIHGGRFALGCT